MKKTLLLSAMILMAIVAVNAQKVWNFANDSVTFPYTSGIAAGTTVNISSLSITAGSTPTNMGQIELSKKDFNSVYYFHRFKFNGGGYTGAADTQTTPTVNMPTQRYISFQVSGNSTIYAIGITGSNSSSRKVFVTDGTTLIGTMSFPAGTILNEATVSYTGAATTLYMFCNASCNLYYLTATNVVLSSINQVLADKGISFNGTEIVNTQNLDIEVYSVLGKKVATSKTTISTNNFQKGVYVVRASGFNDSLKICI